MGIKNERARALARDIGHDLDEDMADSRDFEPDASDEVTDEDALALANSLGDAERDSLERSRKRGRSAHSERGGHRGNEARSQREHRDNEFAFRPLNSLDAPPPRTGMEQRWIRVMLGDKNDVRNWSRQARQHWKPRTLDTVSKEFNPPVQQVAGLGDVIMVGDLILCERDARYGQSRRKFYRKAHERQVEATKRHVKKVEHGDHRITVVDRDETPSVGRGRRVRAQDDE